MALAFPPSPVNGTIYSYNGKTWIYDGIAWNGYVSVLSSEAVVSSLRLSSAAEPTADSTQEGKLVYNNTNNGNLGTLRVCSKMTDGSFAWIPLI